MAHILLVTDDEDISRALSLYLIGHEVLCAEDARRASQILKENLIDLMVFGDVWNTDIYGVDLANAMHTLNPQLPMLLLGRYNETFAGLNTSIKFNSVTPPYDLDEIKLHIRHLLNR